MKIFSNLAVSIDGKIADQKTPDRRLGGAFDWNMMQTLRRQADAILEGTATLRASPLPLLVKGAKKQPLNVILTSSGDLPKAPKFWAAANVIRVILTCEKSYQKALATCGDRALVYACGRDQVDLKLAIKQLKELGVKNLLVEGGGQTIAAFLEAKLLQTMHVTVTPWALGGKQPSLVGGPGLAVWQKLKLLKSRRVGDELYLTYQVKGARRV